MANSIDRVGVYDLNTTNWIDCVCVYYLNSTNHMKHLLIATSIWQWVNLNISNSIRELCYMCVCVCVCVCVHVYLCMPLYRCLSHMLHSSASVVQWQYIRCWVIHMWSSWLIHIGSSWLIHIWRHLNTFGAGSFICGVRDSFISGVRDSFICGDISIHSVLGHLNGNDSHDV